MSEDALIIKLCDRLDNISSLYDTNKAFIDKYLRETISILNYIINNRNLNTIHLNIINDININVASAFKYPPKLKVISLICFPSLRTHFCGI